MSWKIEVHRAKPNPLGKDKNRNHPIASQLLGEWVDLKNIGSRGVDLSQIHLANALFGQACAITKRYQIYWNDSTGLSLLPGEIVRVHTGRSADIGSMAAADFRGVHKHTYAESGVFVLNNACSDILSVWYKDTAGQWQKDDETSYDPRPGEGQILVRHGDKLIAGILQSL
jgi:hypothetical protein